MSLFARLFRRPVPASLPAPVEPPPWAEALSEALTKSARAQAKLGVCVEALDARLEAGFSDLRAALAARPAASTPSVDPVLDVLDALEEAARSLEGDRPEVAEGLRGLVARLERFLATTGVERLAHPTEPLDGKLFRVVGREPKPGQRSGVVTQVVRAAARGPSGVIREGEVIVAEGEPPATEHEESQ